MAELVCKLREIQVELKQSLSDLQMKLEPFYSEPDLLTNLDGTKRNAEARASSLESEVKQLREELKAIRDLLGSNGGKA